MNEDERKEGQQQPIEENDIQDTDSEEVHKYKIQSWDDLLKFTRRNYLKTVEELTKLQENTEGTLKRLIETGTSYSKESTNVIKEWAETMNNSFKKFQKNTEHLFQKASDRAAKELNINVPFQKEVGEWVESVQSNIKSIFDKFQQNK